jgi:HNH endonuclease
MKDIPSDNKILCACGCGQFREAYDNRGRLRQYINGHSKAGRFQIGHKMSVLEKNSRWNGGITYNPKGYRLLKHPEHPHRNNHGYVFEHRLVMEQYIGRYLEPDEVVHHRNGMITDNRIENLELMSNSSHTTHHNIGKSRKGQRCSRRKQNPKH